MHAFDWNMIHDVFTVSLMWFSKQIILLSQFHSLSVVNDENGFYSLIRVMCYEALSDGLIKTQILKLLLLLNLKKSFDIFCIRANKTEHLPGFSMHCLLIVIFFDFAPR